MQIRINMNRLDDDNLDLSNELGNDTKGIYRNNPVLDYRDDETVWVWLRKNICIELERTEIQDILNGFEENR